MVDRRILLRYGQALFDLAEEKGIVDEVGNDLGGMALSLSGDHDLREFLLEPLGSTQAKRDLVGRWLAESTQDLTRDFADMVIARGRVEVLVAVSPVFHEMLENKKQRVRAEVTSAAQLPDDVRDTLIAKLKEVTGRDIELAVSVDESLLGGILIRLGNRLYDGTVQRRLDDLRRQLSEAKLN